MGANAVIHLIVRFGKTHHMIQGPDKGRGYASKHHPADESDVPGQPQVQHRPDDNPHQSSHTVEHQLLLGDHLHLSVDEDADQPRVEGKSDDGPHQLPGNGDELPGDILHKSSQEVEPQLLPVDEDDYQQVVRGKPEEIHHHYLQVHRVAIYGEKDTAHLSIGNNQSSSVV